MKRLQFLNIFNTLLMCSVRYDSIRCAVVQRASFFKMLIAFILVSADTVHLIGLSKDSIVGVAELSGVLRYCITKIIILSVFVEHVIRRKELLNLSHHMLDYLSKMETSSESTNVVHLTDFFVKLQMGSLFIASSALTWVYCYFNWSSPDFSLWIGFGLILYSLSGLYVPGNLIFLQHFPNFLTIEFRQLRSDLGNSLLTQLLNRAESLLAIKRSITQACGVRLLLLLFEVWVNVACASYQMIHFFVTEKLTLEHTISVGITAFVILYSNMVALLGISYSFECCQNEEEEFKSAVKSLQYNAIEVQSDEYLNFLDLVNLKLMTESPKITACGLFTVNLQVFYNVFAAIVTYIMILFQFRDFEK